MMRRLLAIWCSIALATQLVSLERCAASAAPPPMKLAGDPRLQARVEVAAPGRDLGSFLQKAAAASGVSLTADQECADQKIILVGRSHSIGAVLDQIRTQFAFRWVTSPPSGGDAAAPAYRLVMTRERRGLAAGLRAAAERERTARILRRLEKQLLALDASRETLRRLGAADPYFNSSPLNLGQRARLQIVAWLSPAERARVAAGSPFVSPSLAQLPPEVQSTALLASGLSNRPVDLSQLHYTFRRHSEEGADHLAVRVIGADGRPVGSSGDLIPTDAPRRQASVPGIAYSTNPIRKPADPYFERMGELQDDRGEPLSIRAGLPVLLESLARTTGLDVLSDYYAGQTLRFDPEPIGKRPLWQLINIVAEQHCLKWERRGRFLLLRHRDWHEVEPEEIPERVLRSWLADQATGGRVTPDDFLHGLAALTPAQLLGLRVQFRGLTLHPPHHWEHWLATLTGEQREALLAGRTISGQNLAPASTERLQALLQRPESPNRQAVQVQLRVKNQVIELTARSGDAAAQTQWTLPPKGQAPRPILLRLRG